LLFADDFGICRFDLSKVTVGDLFLTHVGIIEESVFKGRPNAEMRSIVKLKSLTEDMRRTMPKHLKKNIAKIIIIFKSKFEASNI